MPWGCPVKALLYPSLFALPRSFCFLTYLSPWAFPKNANYWKARIQY